MRLLIAVLLFARPSAAVYVPTLLWLAPHAMSFAPSVTVQHPARSLAALRPGSMRAPTAQIVASEEIANEEVDVVVIGSGFGGLSCASLLASRGLKVSVLEAHYEIGGCAHEFSVGLDGRTIPSAKLRSAPETPVFKFEAGPSLYSGLSPSASPNPLKHVFQMIGEEPEWITYDTWGAHLPEVPDGYELSIGAENFKEILRRYGGPTAQEDWESLAAQLRPLSAGVMGLPSTAVRGDFGVLATLGLRYPLAFARVLADAPKIVAPFDLDNYGVKDAFLRNYLDLIAFLLQGLPSNGTLTAVMAYMVEDFYREGAIMDFPKGGSGAIADALARGVTKHAGCSVHVSSPVREILIEGGRAAGVKLANGKVVRARKAVVSNADLHATFGLIPEGVSIDLDVERRQLLGDESADGVPLCKSFMHVHLGVRASDLPADLPPQWTIVNSWDVPIDAPGNVIVVSVPSLLDPSLAPPGHHVIHAYTAGNEPYDVWQRFEGKDTRGNSEYQALKAERAEPIFEAIRRRVPNIRDAIIVEQVGTPLTHARFLRRHRGNYGLAIAAGNAAGLEFPKVTTPLPGLYRCGDSTTAGIGVPAVAASGAQCANALLSVWEQLSMNELIRM